MAGTFLLGAKVLSLAPTLASRGNKARCRKPCVHLMTSEVCVSSKHRTARSESQAHCVREHWGQLVATQWGRRAEPRAWDTQVLSTASPFPHCPGRKKGVPSPTPEWPRRLRGRGRKSTRSQTRARESEPGPHAAHRRVAWLSGLSLLLHKVGIGRAPP